MIIRLLSRLNQLQDTRLILEASLRIISEEMGLSGGWVWLLSENGGAFYLAATHKLPTELSARQDLLGGECWCLQQYLEGELVHPGNVSEIKCSRIDKLPEHAGQLRYHATVPLRYADRSFGLLNLLHTDSRVLTEADLALLAEAGQHLGAALWRATNLKASETKGAAAGRKDLLQRLQRLWGEGQGEIGQQLNQLALEISDAAPSRRKTSVDYPSDPLTARETEVLREIALGLTNRQIAGRLFISERTVKFHVSAVLDKLNVGNRTAAAETARQRGLLD